jgi:hypothetical protein
MYIQIAFQTNNGGTYAAWEDLHDVIENCLDGTWTSTGDWSGLSYINASDSLMAGTAPSSNLYTFTKVANSSTEQSLEIKKKSYAHKSNTAFQGSTVIKSIYTSTAANSWGIKHGTKDGTSVLRPGGNYTSFEGTTTSANSSWYNMFYSPNYAANAGWQPLVHIYATDKTFAMSLERGNPKTGGQNFLREGAFFCYGDWEHIPSLDCWHWSESDNASVGTSFMGAHEYYSTNRFQDTGKSTGNGSNVFWNGVNCPYYMKWSGTWTSSSYTNSASSAFSHYWFTSYNNSYWEVYPPQWALVGSGAQGAGGTTKHVGYPVFIGNIKSGGSNYTTYGDMSQVVAAPMRNFNRLGDVLRTSEEIGDCGDKVTIDGVVYRVMRGNPVNDTSTNPSYNISTSLGSKACYLIPENAS